MTDVRCSDIQAKNSDVRFRCLMIVSRLAGRPTVAIWMRVGGANYIITSGWQWHGALAFEAGDTTDDNSVVTTIELSSPPRPISFVAKRLDGS